MLSLFNFLRFVVASPPPAGCGPALALQVGFGGLLAQGPWQGLQPEARGGDTGWWQSLLLPECVDEQYMVSCLHESGVVGTNVRLANMEQEWPEIGLAQS
jgi:hypothetical protein